MNIHHTVYTQVNKAIVTASARLHMGFFDLNGSAGRMFGSLGVSLDTPETVIEVTKSESLLIAAKNHDYVSKIVDNLIKSLNIDKNFNVKILQAMPKHAGLGSGTQMALAIGAGLNALFDLNLSATQIAMATQRGARSGIGIGTFAQGGAVVDGGVSLEKNGLPPIIARHDFPENWRILLIMDKAEQGVHGEQELQAFNTLPKANLETAQTLAYSVLMQALPALVECDYAAFSSAVYKLQHATGEHFAPTQGGIFKSKSVTKVLNCLYQNNVLCAGQSSWGPTGFAIFEDDSSAIAMQKLLQQQFATFNNISFQLVRAKNTGASIHLG